MKKLITFSLVMFSVCILFAQTENGDDYYAPTKPKTSFQERVTTSIEMGAGVSVFNKTNTGLTSYVAPKISYLVSPKFKLNLGMMHYSITGNTFMPLSFNEALVNTSNRAITGNVIFVGGEYQLNKKLIASGAVMADVNSLSNNKFNSKAVQMGLEYKVTEHSSIKVTTTLGEGQRNYFNNNTTNQNTLFPLVR